MAPIIIECIIAGGPQHGLVCRPYWDSRRGTPLAVTGMDGQLCIAAARRHTDDAHPQFILLHPQATGEQFLTLLAA
ncbi:hypothetical protein B0E46_04195 [Rhodanobacter sp. B04]|uniref:hypothetical protein n=1 Tax=Rhodanobacter sp. B04 TaxID=1945860 RepID=UPI000984C947|nr:hypothetical protein [Rhodanobacter sp. B04]OOG65551.1 hypothetical protein B0E46_04195 [Rhodanobacter sp. B04]